MSIRVDPGERCIRIVKSISKGCEFKDYVRIDSHNLWFGKTFSTHVYWDKIVFKHRGIDYNGKVRNIKIHFGTYRIEMCESLPLGTFYFDEEESNEDQIVIYFNQ